MEIENKFIDLIGSRTRDLPACSIVPYPLRYRVPPSKYKHETKDEAWCVLNTASPSAELAVKDLDVTS
jgi:hypothetical protein